MPNGPLPSGVGIGVQRGKGEFGLTPSRQLQPVWAILTDTGPASAPGSYQWQEVYRDNNGKWQKKDEGEDFEGGFKSQITQRETSPYDDIITNPAREVGDNRIRVGNIVKLYPQRVILDEDQNVHREWLFAKEDGLRPFKLIQDLVPELGEGTKTSTVAAEWMDQLGTTVTLYPAHTSGFPGGDVFLSHGFGISPGMFFRGTYGWAQYQEHGTQLGFDDAGAAVWRGEWQIVTLYAETIAEVEVEQTNGIVGGQLGPASLFAIDKDRSAPRVRNTGFNIEIFNNLDADLDNDDLVHVYYNRNMARWVTMWPPLPAAITVYASATVSTFSTVPASTDAVLVQIPLDTDLVGDEAGDFIATTGVNANHLLDLDAVNEGVKNIGEVDLVVRVSWLVTAQRVIVAADQDIDSYCEVVLQNDGQSITGIRSRMTSSRRVAVGEGNLAVNNCPGNCIQLLKPGKTLTLHMMKNLSFVSIPVSPNDWITVPEMCHMTVKTIRGVALEAVP